MAALRASNIIHLASAAAAATESVTDRRRAPRRRVLKGAVAAFNDRHCTIPCTVRDLSATGARLKCDGSVNIPDTFELIVELDGTEADCEVVWRKANEVGVRFRGAPRRLTPRRQQIIELSVPDRSLTLRRRSKQTD